MIIAAHLQWDEKKLEALICEAKGEPIVICGWNHTLLKDEAAYHRLLKDLQTDMAYREKGSDERLSVHDYSLSDLFVDTNTSEAKQRADQYVAHCTDALREWLLGTVALRRIANKCKANIFLVPGALDTSQGKLAGMEDYVRSKWENQHEQRAVLKEFLEGLRLCKDESLFDNKDITYLHLKTVDIDGMNVKGIGGVITPTDDVPTIFQENTLLHMAQPKDRPEELVKLLQQPADVTLLLQTRPSSLDGLSIPEQHAWKLVNDFLPQDKATETLFDVQRKNPLLLAQRVVRAETGLSRNLIEFSADYHRAEVIGEEDQASTPAAKPAVPRPEPAPVSPPKPAPAATPVEAPDVDVVPAHKEPATYKARPAKAKRKAQKPEAPIEPPKPYVPKARKPSKFELLIENIWSGLDDTVKTMPEAKKDALVAIKETLLERGKHKERIKALESTVEIVACGLVDKSMDAAEALLTSYVYYLGKIGFAKKHPAEYKQLATLATGLLAKYVNGLKHENRELTKYIAVAKRKYRNAAKLSERAHKQELANLRQKLKEGYETQLKKYEEQIENRVEQIKKYEDELDQVYVEPDDDTKVKERTEQVTPGEEHYARERQGHRDKIKCLEDELALIKDLHAKDWKIGGLVKDKKYDAAITILERLQQRDLSPGWNAHVAYQLGNVHLRNRDPEKALPYFEQAKKICDDPKTADSDEEEWLQSLRESAEYALAKVKVLISVPESASP